MSKHKFVIFVVMLCSMFLIAGAIGCGPGAPEAQFTVNATSGNAPLSLWFTDLSTGEIESWEWDFDNDGVTDSVQQYVMHTYEQPGTYTVVLTVSGPGGVSSEVKTDYITVSECEVKADFVASPTTGYGPTVVQFTDMSVGDVVSWAWDFNGDGGFDSFEQNPSYLYNYDGYFSITLVITTADGCTDTVTKQGYISISGCST
ncbi:MAG: PKD domain-containing protein [Dehalococcoidia bacterium]